MDKSLRYVRQHALEGVGEAGQELFFSTEVVCEGESPALQTAAAYLEAAGFCMARHAAPLHPGFWPSAWQPQAACAPREAAASACRQRGFLGQLPCARPDGFAFWVLMGCLQGAPAFFFARGQGQQPFLDAQFAAAGPALNAAFRAVALALWPTHRPPTNVGAPQGDPRLPAAFSPAPPAAEGRTPGPAHFLMAAWAALAFEKLALGLSPEAGGGSIGPEGEAALWGEP